jgi:hypothetical protein
MDWAFFLVRARTDLKIGHYIAIGALYFCEKFAELAGVFFAGARFCAAGYVHGVRPNEANRLGHVFRREPACKNDTVRFCGATGDGPIGAFSGTAILACSGGVE